MPPSKHLVLTNETYVTDVHASELSLTQTPIVVLIFVVLRLFTCKVLLKLFSCKLLMKTMQITMKIGTEDESV